jgi:hypothetical protein
MTTEERVTELERKIEAYDALIAKLMALAAASPVGRKLLKKVTA